MDASFLVSRVEAASTTNDFLQILEDLGDSTESFEQLWAFVGTQGKHLALSSALVMHHRMRCRSSSYSSSAEMLWSSTEPVYLHTYQGCARSPVPYLKALDTRYPGIDLHAIWGNHERQRLSTLYAVLWRWATSPCGYGFGDTYRSVDVVLSLPLETLREGVAWLMAQEAAGERWEAWYAQLDSAMQARVCESLRTRGAIPYELGGELYHSMLDRWERPDVSSWSEDRILDFYVDRELWWRFPPPDSATTSSSSSFDRKLYAKHQESFVMGTIKHAMVEEQAPSFLVTKYEEDHGYVDVVFLSTPFRQHTLRGTS